MLDIDDFKKINDRWGHPVGDVVLRGLVEELTKGVREMDTVARYGGEEFALIFPETTPAKAWVVADRLRNRVASTSLRRARARPPARRHDLARPRLLPRGRRARSARSSSAPTRPSTRPSGAARTASSRRRRSRTSRRSRDLLATFSRRLRRTVDRARQPISQGGPHAPEPIPRAPARSWTCCRIVGSRLREEGSPDSRSGGESSRSRRRQAAERSR